MTIKEAQELIEAWVHKHPTQEDGDLNIMSQFSENLDELASKSSSNNLECSKELSEMIWLTTVLANRYNVDLTAALIDNLEQKNRLESE